MSLTISGPSRENIYGVDGEKKRTVEKINQVIVVSEKKRSSSLVGLTETRNFHIKSLKLEVPKPCFTCVISRIGLYYEHTHDPHHHISDTGTEYNRAYRYKSLRNLRNKFRKQIKGEKCHFFSYYISDIGKECNRAYRYKS